ncbi:hypothetical protein C0Z17_00070 [Trinickia caryophylli]|nr:hypothetical protein C0Z17_00070 [Trinickia caryophylli]
MTRLRAALAGLGQQRECRAGRTARSEAMEMKVEMLPEFVAFCDQEKTTAEAVLRCFMRDVLAVYEGKQEPSDTALGVVQAYAWSYFVRVTNPERYF